MWSCCWWITHWFRSIGKDFSFTEVLHSIKVYITQNGLVAGGKKSKEGRQTVFFTPLDQFGSDAHEEEEPSEDYSKPRKEKSNIWPSEKRSKRRARGKNYHEHKILDCNLGRQNQTPLLCVNQCQNNALKELLAMMEVESYSEGFWHRDQD